MSKLKGRVLEGVVISDKMDKTIVVKVVSRFSHPLYRKQIINRKKYKVHDSKDEAKLGDRVRIIEAKPISKDKKFRLVEVVK